MPTPPPAAKSCSKSKPLKRPLTPDGIRGRLLCAARARPARAFKNILKYGRKISFRWSERLLQQAIEQLRMAPFVPSLAGQGAETFITRLQTCCAFCSSMEIIPDPSFPPSYEGGGNFAPRASCSGRAGQRLPVRGAAAAVIAAAAGAGIAAPAGSRSVAAGRPGDGAALVALARAGAVARGIAAARSADGAGGVGAARIAAGILNEAREDHAAKAAGVTGIAHRDSSIKKMSRSIALHDILCRTLPWCYETVRPPGWKTCSAPCTMGTAGSLTSCGFGSCSCFFK